MAHKEETKGIRPYALCLYDMSIVYASAPLGARPSYWSKKCVDTVKLPKTMMDPRKQAFMIASDGFDRASYNGNGDVKPHKQSWL